MSLQERILNCQKCPRLREVTPLPLFQVSWVPNPDVVTIGRNPGLEHKYDHITREELQEFYKEKWLISRYGKYLIGELGADFVQNHIYATNVCKCSSPKNTNLYEAEIQNCVPYLFEQLREVKPRFILCFGNDAFSAMAPQLEDSGRFWKFENAKVLKLYHPAYFLYKQNEIEKKEYQAKLLKTVKRVIEENM